MKKSLFVFRTAALLLLAFSVLFASPSHAAMIGAGAMPFIAIGDTAPFPIIPELTAVSIAYKNPRNLADDILQRVPVGKASFRYRLYNLADSFSIPDTRVGRTSAPNQISIGFTEETASTVDWGLDEPIPQEDLDNAPAGYNPQSHAVEILTSLIALDREKRTADLVFDAANFASTNKTTLTGNDRWSVYAQAATASDPIEDIQVGLDACIMRPTHMVFGRPYWSILTRHPNIIKAVTRSVGDKGIASKQGIADLFEIDVNNILIGDGWRSSAKKGQTATLVRLWGLKCLLFYRDPLANTNSGTTFGFTAQFGTRVAGSIPDPDIGLNGGVKVRAGERVKELITANNLGYLITEGNS